MSDWLSNIVSKEILQDNLSFVSLFIAVYEHTVDYTVSSIRSLLCDLSINEGNECWKETEHYKREIRNRVVDTKGNKDITKASFLWLIDNDAISTADYDRFIEIKSIRNKYAHELISVIFEGVSEAEVKLLFDMIALLQKIGRWFYVNVDAPIMGYEIPEGLEPGDIQSAGSAVLQILLDVLYNGKSEEYKTLVTKIRGAKNDASLHIEV